MHSNCYQAGVDYLSIDERFSLGGARQKCFNFFSVNDDIPELTETVGVTVSTLSSHEQILEQRNVLITIVDDDGEFTIMI